MAFNTKHGITPTTIQRAIHLGIEEFAQAEDLARSVTGQSEEQYEAASEISELERQMDLAARNLEFERAAKI
ncbi:MAG: UvrB/UvrC motif-containing protein, partial [Candidatus Omnitrophica bacterium]|nr:UvrB/UvrC motif-containing protein [Candidatus Omnitrophota bacterium]